MTKLRHATTKLRQRFVIEGPRTGIIAKNTVARRLLSLLLAEGSTMGIASRVVFVGGMMVGGAFAIGCSPATEFASVGFALPSSTVALAGVSTKPIETHAVRVLGTRIDLRQPVFVQRADDAIEVTFAVRQRNGITMRLDARTLNEVGERTPFLYPRCSARDVSAHLARDAARVTLERGETVTVFTSDEHNRAFARIGAGPAFAVSPEGMPIVGPARASANGHDVVAVFVAATDDGFALVATSLEIADHR